MSTRRAVFLLIFITFFVIAITLHDVFLTAVSSSSLAYLLSEVWGAKNKSNFELNRRQKDILNLLSQGYSVSEVANQLNIDRKTVYKELKNIVSLIKSDLEA